MEHLNGQLEKDADLGFSLAHDEEGRLDRVLFMLKHWKSLWMESQGKVVLYDTKHGTNRYAYHRTNR